VPSARIVLAVVLIAVALALQVTLLSRLPLPGATPDLLLLVVVSLALAYGPGFGLACGFAAGLAADRVPPADHEVGRWALVLTLIGYLAGLARAETRRSAVVPLVVVAVAGGGSGLLYAYDVVLCAFVVPGVLALAGRAEPQQMVHA
jgi:rod shape-determining protein MreD